MEETPNNILKPVRLWQAFFVFCIVLSLLLSSCGRKKEAKGFAPPPTLDTLRCTDFQFPIDSLPYAQLPNTGYSLKTASDSAYPRDAEEVSMVKINDSLYYHPVDMCHKTFVFLDLYHSTKDSLYLGKARRFVDRLIKESMTFDGALYFPYKFDYNLHQRDEGFIKAPWFSGMAQGEALGVLSRMYIAAGDSIYLEYANKTFASLVRLRDSSGPWVAFIDSRGCFWIEEYPLWPPSMTLNGFIFALYGVYDYYELTKNPEAAKVLKDSFSTIKNYIPIFRRPGQPSFYGLRFGHYTFEYHPTHIKQLRMLARMTGDVFFNIWADSMKKDQQIYESLK